MSLEITNPTVTATVSSSPHRTRQNRGLMFGLKLLWVLVRLLTVRNLIIFAVVSAFTVVLFIFANYFAHLVFTKPKQVSEGSLVHDYFVSEFVKELPAFKPLENSTQYFINVISNNSHPSNIMRYESVAPPEEIISYYRLYFQILNYTYVKHSFESEAMAMFRNTRQGFTVFVSVGENVNTVSLEYFKYD
jgi:hypothetical protein